MNTNNHLGARLPYSKFASLVLSLISKAPTTPSNLLYSLTAWQLSWSIYTPEKTEAQGHLVTSPRASVFSIVKREGWFSSVVCGSYTGKSFIRSFTGSFRAYYIPGTVAGRQDLCTPTDSRETKNEDLDKVMSGSDKL